MGYIRVAFGSLKVESQCAWASVSNYTAPEKGNQVHCYEGGENCQSDSDAVRARAYAAMKASKKAASA